MESSSMIVKPHEENASVPEGFWNTIPPKEGSSPADAQLTPPASDASGSRKRKERTLREEKYFFKLFKFPEVVGAEKEDIVDKALEIYLLEIHEVGTGIDRYKVFTHETNGIWKVTYEDLAPGDHVVIPVLQDPTIPIFNKIYDISLEERLSNWSKEKKQRSKGKKDTFYYHRNKLFRSFIEVITFIIYSCDAKDLKNTNNTTHEAHEFDAGEAMVTTSSPFGK